MCGHQTPLNSSELFFPVLQQRLSFPISSKLKKNPEEQCIPTVQDCSTLLWQQHHHQAKPMSKILIHRYSSITSCAGFVAETYNIYVYNVCSKECVYTHAPTHEVKCAVILITHRIEKLPLWSSGQSSWLQTQMSRFDS
jgi:hypothetical protein